MAISADRRYCRWARAKWTWRSCGPSSTAGTRALSGFLATPTTMPRLGCGTTWMDSIGWSRSSPAKPQATGRVREREYQNRHQQGATVRSDVPAGGGASPYEPEQTSALAADAKKHGDAHRGAEVFAPAKFACLSCHQVGKNGGTIGPSLSEIGRTQNAEQIAEAVLWPRRQVKPEYHGLAGDDLRRPRCSRLQAKGSDQRLELFDPTTNTKVDRSHETTSRSSKKSAL